MRYNLKLLFPLIISGVFVGVHDHASAQQSDNSITISPSDFRLSREEVMERVAALEVLGAASVSTAEYARRFSELQDDLTKTKPPLSQWKEADRERVENLKEPTAAAWEALRTEQASAQERIRTRNAEAAQDYQARLQETRELQRLQQSSQMTESEARLKEAQIREAEARTDYYDDAYPVYGNGWWYNSGPWRPSPRKPWENRYYGTKPNIPNNYQPNPIWRR